MNLNKPNSKQPSPSPPFMKGGQGGFLNRRGDKFSFLPFNKKLGPYARENRKSSTKSEKILWSFILKKDQTGYRFLRQKPIGNYILDFFCAKLMLAIEVDGDSHDEKSEYDRERDIVLEAIGIKTLRIKDYEVINDIDQLKVTLLKALDQREKELKL
jgi:very-short-patch-repair endonuclease